MPQVKSYRRFGPAEEGCLGKKRQLPLDLAGGNTFLFEFSSCELPRVKCGECE
jgi:hypothetical protein